MISDLQGGGDKGKMTWLAICGAEFPEVVGKVIDAQKSDASIDFMVYTGATPGRYAGGHDVEYGCEGLDGG